VRLLGGNYVAFRTTDGRVGVIDEQCPHRRASLALTQRRQRPAPPVPAGRSTHGEVAEAPNHAGEQQKFPEHVRVNRYGAGARRHVWVWLGKATRPRSSRTCLRRPARRAPRGDSQEVPTNWVQAVEASMDSHVGVLQSTSQIAARRQRRAS
jgi:phthalate 4,5-dioxygenase oxygenase subunit